MLSNENKDDAFVIIKSSVRENDFIYNPYVMTKKAGGTWGECMDKAIDELYDDWVDDPVGTFSCWLTGPLCAIGGGIACGLQQL